MKFLLVFQTCRKERVPGWFKFVPFVLRGQPAFSKVKVTGIRDLSLGVPFVAGRRVESICVSVLGLADCVPEAFIRKKKMLSSWGRGYPNLLAALEDIVVFLMVFHHIFVNI